MQNKVRSVDLDEEERKVKRGRPRKKWADEALKECWEEIRKNIATEANKEYENNNKDMIGIIKTYKELILAALNKD